MMVARFWCFAFILAFSSACFAAKNKNIKKRSKVPWFQERANHAARGLSDTELQNVATLGDEQHFFQMLKPILIPRVVGTPGHTAVRQFIVSQMDTLNWTVEEDQFVANTPVGKKTFTNVIATLNPSATRRLVIACHYDSKLTPEGFLGAIDSAVPCSMMLNLAHILKGPLAAHRSQRNDLTLQFMFIDGEEAFVQWSASDSIYGAKNLANKLHSASFPPGAGPKQTTELDRIDLFVLLDLVGTEDCGFFSFFGESEVWYSRLASFEKRLSSLKLINPRTPIFREKTYYGANIEDDHVPFLRKGVPILHLISAPFPSVWHKMSDNFQSLHAPTIANLNTILRAFVVDYLHLDL